MSGPYLGNSVDKGVLYLLVELKEELLPVSGEALPLEDVFRFSELSGGDGDLEVGGVPERFDAGDRLIGDNGLRLGVKDDPGLIVGLGDRDVGVISAGNEEYSEYSEELPGVVGFRLGDPNGQDGCLVVYSAAVCGEGSLGAVDRDVTKGILYRVVEVPVAVALPRRLAREDSDGFKDRFLGGRGAVHDLVVDDT